MISPLLLNIALHGMEQAIDVTYNTQGQISGKRAVVRYADDFVCFCETKEDAEQVQETLTAWLKERGLTLSAEKTRIVHLLEGFNFLGFNIRHYRTPKTTKTGWKLLIKPSKEAVQDLRKKLKDRWKKVQGTNVQHVLKELNPIIRGWANYFRIAVAKELFGKLDSWMVHKALHYTKRMHPKKSVRWQRQRYFGHFNLDRLDSWTFGDKQTGGYALKFEWFPIERHILVKGRASPDDPQLKEYWMKRQEGQAKDLTISKQKLSKRQKGRCLQCFESLFNGEEISSPSPLVSLTRREDAYSNLVLVHHLCHQQIHAQTDRAISDCQQYNDQKLSAEESQMARTVRPEE